MVSNLFFMSSGIKLISHYVALSVINMHILIFFISYILANSFEINNTLIKCDITIRSRQSIISVLFDINPVNINISKDINPINFLILPHGVYLKIKVCYILFTSWMTAVMHTNNQHTCNTFSVTWFQDIFSPWTSIS